MSYEPPDCGFVFWPVGNGDSTTIFVKPGVVVQVDVNHRGCANDDDDPRSAVVDRLVEVLPKVNGRPYLSVFVLTHPDEDHCCGFRDLLKRVTIGELWHTPRIFRDSTDDLCDDAVAFRKEAHRRAKLNGVARSGDRFRLIGYDTLLEEEVYSGLPKSLLTLPGTAVTELDGNDCADVFRAFIHAPFKDDCAGERNDTSLAMQITIADGENIGRLLLLGDLRYPTLKRIFEISDGTDLAWDVLLAPHHCSKSAMYWCGADEQEETLRRDILDAIEAAATEPGIIIASSDEVPDRDDVGANPPHANAKARYEEVAPGGFCCTADDAPQPITFELAGDGLTTMASAWAAATSSVREAVVAARGGGTPPKDRVGFGRGT